MNKKNAIRVCAAFLVVSLTIGTATHLEAQVTGVSISFSPSVDYTLFDDNAGLKSAPAFGGTLGLGFGQYIEFHANYHYGNRYSSNFGLLRGGDENLTQLLEDIASVDITRQQFGVSAKLNLSSAAIVPYFSAGTGVVQFSRNALKPSQSIYISGGFGLMASVASRYTIFAQGSLNGYRYNPGSSFFGGPDLNNAGLRPQNFSMTEVRNWNLTAGFKTYLGGSRNDRGGEQIVFLDEFNGGWSNIRYSLDAVYGQLSLDESLGFRDVTHISGFQLGADFGPFVGVKAFYWHGIDERDGVQLDELWAAGGMITGRLLRANTTPYLDIGGGYLSVGTGYDPGMLTNPQSQMFAMAGAGLETAIVRNVMLNGSIHALAMTRDGVDNLTSPSKIVMSPMFKVGVSYRVGNFVRRNRRDVAPRTAAVYPSAAPTAVSDRLNADQQARIMREVALSTEIARALSQGDTLMARNLQLELDRVRATESGTGTRATDQRMFTLPVLENGEIYIRFGSSESTIGGQGRMTADQRRIAELEDRLERMAQSRPAEADSGSRGESSTVVVTSPAAPTSAAGTLTEEDLNRRLREFEDRITVLLERHMSRTDTVPQTPAPASRVVIAREEQTAGDLVGLSAYFGFANPAQAVFGMRADYGTVLGNRIQLMPEFVIGVGSKTMMYHINALVLANLPSMQWMGDFNPYAGTSLGLMAFSNPPSSTSGIQFTLGLNLGFDYEWGPGVAFAEYNTLNFFAYNRLLVGYRFRF